MTDGPKTPVIMDVDTGVDDAVAIALATRLTELDLIGLTTVAGNVDVEKTTRIRCVCWRCSGAPTSRSTEA